MNFLLVSCLIMAIIATGVTGITERICEPGTTRDGLCGQCACSDDGTEEKCDNASCLQYSSEGQHIRNDGKRIVRDASDRCIPGQSFRMGCNTCFCTDSGLKSQAACTLIACLSPETSRPSRRNQQRFYPRW